MTKTARAPLASTRASATPASVAMPDWMKGRKAVEKASTDLLQSIQIKADELRDLLVEKERLKERTTENNKDIEKIQRTDLPVLMMEAKLDHIGVAPHGNMPGYDFPLDDDIYANIAAEWPEAQREAGFRVVHELDGKDLIKTEIFIFVPAQKGSDKFVQRIAKGIDTLIKNNPDAGITYKTVKKIQWNTLSSWVGELISKGKELTSEQKQAIGARIGKIVKPKVRKNA